jgi:hypothetical protein
MVVLGGTIVQVQEQSVPFPGGAANSVAQVAYVRNLEDGITAIDLRRGSTLWKAKTELKPVAVFNGLLVALSRAQDGSPAVVLAEPDASLMVKKTIPLTLPSGVRVTTEFRYRAGIVGSALTLHWRFDPPTLTGYSRQAGAPAVDRPPSAGTLAIDLESGTARSAPSASPLAPESGGEPAATKDGRYAVQVSRTPRSVAQLIDTKGDRPIAEVPYPDHVEEIAVIEPYIYLLAARFSNGIVAESIQAIRRGSGAIAWEIPLGSRPALRPVR